MTERKPYDVQRAADRVVTSYVNRKWGIALQNLFKEKNKQGCGCRSCAHKVVREVNSWTRFGIENEQIADEKSYHVDENGIIRRNIE